MTVSPNSFRDYIASSSQTVFPIVIDRISDEHLRVFQNGAVLTLTTDYTVSGANVTLVVPATAGDKVRIQRDTPQLTRSVDFMAGANITEQDLDNSALHNLYLAQEVWDQTLQLRDTPVVTIDWSLGTLPVIETGGLYHQDAASRRTPTLGTVLGAGQPWISVDAVNKEVDLAPGKYQIAISFTAREFATTLFSAAVGNDQDGGSSALQFTVISGTTLGGTRFLSSTYLVNLTSRKSLTFKMASLTAGGDIFLIAPCQWIITRLGGDPENN